MFLRSTRVALGTLLAASYGLGGTAVAGGESPAEPGVVQKIENGIARGAQAAASGVERGVRAAASGVERGVSAAARGVQAAASGVARGAKATGEAVDSVARKAGLPASAPTSGTP